MTLKEPSRKQVFMIKQPSSAAEAGKCEATERLLNKQKPSLRIEREEIVADVNRFKSIISSSPAKVRSWSMEKSGKTRKQSITVPETRT